MDSFPCPKCSKVLSTKYWLDQHIEKPLPCDFKCKLCDFKGKDRYQYYRHQKTKHPKTTLSIISTQKEEDDVLTLEPVQPQGQIDFIPIEDFNWKYLESIADNVEVSERFYEKVEHSKDKDGKDAVERIQGYERRTKLIFRAENARRSLPNAIMSNILSCLCNRCDLSEMMLKLLHDVHAQRAEPRLLTIRANDVNRKNVSIYSRPPPTDECFWMTNSNSVALKKTRDHCESLFKFALVSAIESLYPALQVEPSRVVWLVCPSKIPGTNLHKAFTLTKDRNGCDLVCEHQIQSEDLIKLTDETNKFYGFSKQIRAKIEQRREDILERLKQVVMDDKQLNEFFELAKDASIGLNNPNANSAC